MDTSETDPNPTLGTAHTEEEARDLIGIEVSQPWDINKDLSLAMVTVTITDPAHAPFRASLEYLVSPGEPNPFFLRSLSLTQKLKADVNEMSRLGARIVRDLPIARWDKLAQAALWQKFGDNTTPIGGADEEPKQKLWAPIYPGAFISSATGEMSIVPVDPTAPPPSEAYILPMPPRRPTAPDPAARRQRAEEIVRKLRPDLDPTAGKAAARTWQMLVRYAEITEEYIDELARGTPNAVGILAARHHVGATTVRSWLHRARQAGIKGDPGFKRVAEEEQKKGDRP